MLSRVSYMNGEGFISSVENNLITLAPITKFIITKQLKDLQLDKGSMTPDDAMTFINRMTGALVMCLGTDGSKLARKIMIKQLREHAPDYFEEIENGVTV